MLSKQLYILIEDESGRKLVERIMEQYCKSVAVDYELKGFKGLGHWKKASSKLSAPKTGKLLNDLPKYLKGFDKSHRDMGDDFAVFVLLDSDDADCRQLKLDLTEMYRSLDIKLQVFFCIAIEEMEAWLLGDSKALFKAYPNSKNHLLQKYDQDAVIGTWEYLADVLDIKWKKEYSNPGEFKCECADRIGQFLDIRSNQSPSFNYFIGKLDEFCL
ncbi:MAG: DUF4276 family protein [Bacillota bacterium]|nr:DUF4276 family protein [Bacillota bacterium]